MKKNITISVMLFITFYNSSFGQIKEKVCANFGVNYVFTKSKNLKTKFEFNAGLNFATGNYFYVGPKVVAILIKGEKDYLEIGPSWGINISKLVSEKIIKPDNENYKNVDMLISSFYGFNLDKNSKDKRAFQFTNASVSLDISSTKIVKNSFYLSYGTALLFERLDKTIKINKIGLGGVVQLKSE